MPSDNAESREPADDEGRAVKVLTTIVLDDGLLQQIRDVDPRLQVATLDQEACLLFWGRPLSPGADAAAAQRRLDDHLAEVEVIYGFPPSVEQAGELLAKAPRLRWFQAASAGVDRIDETGFGERGVRVTNSSGVHATPIGEFIVLMMLMFAKGAYRFLRAKEERRWIRFVPGELKGSTVGIVGMGHIGAEAARLAKAFGCRVLAIRRSVTARRQGDAVADELLPPSALPYLLSESDYVVLAVPLTQETRHLIASDELRSMKPTAVLINISRGAVVDEGSLVQALKEGWIAGAGLDVFQREPLPEDSELWGIANLILSPHVSGGTEHYWHRAVPIFCENLRRYLDGRPLLNLVDPERGY